MADGAPAPGGVSVRPARTYTVGPVHRAIQVLRCVGASPVPLSLRRISGLVGLPKSTVFRYLRTLAADGLIAHDTVHDLYQIDPNILSLLPLNGDLQRLREIARPHMNALHERFAAPIKLGVVEGSDALCIETVSEPTSQRDRTARTSARQPIYSSVMGRAILASVNTELRSRILSMRDPAARKTVEHDLACIRARGFAIDTGDDSRTIAVPILAEHGEPMASISATVGCHENQQAEIQVLASALGEASAGIAATFAFHSVRQTHRN